MNVLGSGRGGQLAQRSPKILGVSFRDGCCHSFLIITLPPEQSRSLCPSGRTPDASTCTFGHLRRKELDKVLALLRRSTLKNSKKPGPKLRHPLLIGRPAGVLVAGFALVMDSRWQPDQFFFVLGNPRKTANLKTRKLLSDPADGDS